MTKRTHPGLSICLVALAMGLFAAAAAQQAGNGAPPKSAKAAKNPVQEISLPQYPTELPAGPNLDVFQNKCLLCHSARYVTMQPRFSRAVWEKVVKKMVDAYGASISAPEQVQIVDYLVAIKGPVESN